MLLALVSLKIGGGFFCWLFVALKTAGRSAIIQVTHSPCLSRFAVTHIKGEFFYCLSVACLGP